MYWTTAVPGWLRELARPRRGPAPWPQMGFAALAIGVPMAAGLATARPALGTLVAVGGLIGAMADRTGPYPMRMRRIAMAGVFGGAAGLLLGTMATSALTWNAALPAGQ